MMFSIELDDQSAAALNNENGWQDGGVSRITETVYLFGKKDDTPAGQTVLSLNIEGFEQRQRTVRIESVNVRPECRRNGLGSAFLDRVGQVAEQFEADEITGIISATDVEIKPWLKDFYREGGFDLIPVGGSFELVKKL